MTIIAIRDGILAVDSYIGGNGVFHGAALKFAKVLDAHGGGYIAGAGCFAEVSEFIKMFSTTGTADTGKENTFFHIRANGTVSNYEGGWYEYSAPFYVAGSGQEIAVGALAHGATAEESVKIACKYVNGCGGKIHVMSINDG